MLFQSESRYARPQPLLADAEPTRVEAEDHSELINALMLLAFCDDPIWRHIYPNPRDYLEKCPRLLRAYCDGAFSAGEVRLLQHNYGAALWLSPEAAPDYDAMRRIIREDVAAERQPDALAMFDDLAKYTPQEPHWFLALIGVEPARRGIGGGTALLRATLERCDREGAVAYLTSTKSDNIPFFARSGFEILGTSQVFMTPPIYPMIRYPR